MAVEVFLAVLFAALLHSVWNALLKSGADKLVGMAAVMIGHAMPATIALMFVDWPNPASYPYMVASVVFHFGYQVFLLNAYKIGDLTQVYPLARGSAPVIVTLVSVLILGVLLSQIQLIAVALICLGIFSLVLVRGAEGLRNPKAAFLAICTGFFIAGYSLVDGLGAREAGTSVGFISLAMLANSLVFAIYVGLVQPGALPKMFKEGRASFFVGGWASYIAYALVVWAFTQAPIALVTALRETSIVFALIIGVFFLKERLDLLKVASTFLTMAGAFLLRFSK